MVDETVKMISICGFEGMLCTSGSVVEYRLAKARVAGSNPVSCFFYLQKKIKKSLKARDSLRPRRADAQVRMPSLRPLPWAALGQTLPSRAFFHLRIA